MKQTLCALMALVAVAVDGAPLESESPGVRSLPASPSPHWIWVDDMVFNYMADGRATLIDGDTGTYLGMLSTGVAFLSLTIPSDYSAIYSVETYYERGLRGKRTDVVTIYDPVNLLPIDEIEIPPKRSVQLATLTNAVLTDDDRFLLIYNFTPAQSVHVVDMAARKFVGEIPTPGCAQIYPVGNRKFHMLCGDGSALSVDLDEDGGAGHKELSKPFFNPDEDPIQEEAVRSGSEWSYISNGGDIYSIDTAGAQPKVSAPWSVLSDTDRKERWLPGGSQMMVLHEPSRRLYLTMHQGGLYSHKDPGSEIWVFNFDTHERIQRIVVTNPVTSMTVTKDAKPLLVTAFMGSTTVDIYDALTGKHLRAVDNIGASPLALQTP